MAQPRLSWIAMQTVMSQHDSGEYVECYVAFLDILGFTALVQRSQKCRDTRAALVRALNVVATLSPSEHSKCEILYEKNRITAPPTKIWRTQIRFFSDNVVIFVSEETHALSDILWKIRFLHDHLLNLGCCIRGAVTVGDMYWNNAWSDSTANKRTLGIQLDAHDAQESVRILYDRDAPPTAPITLGQGLIDAYKLESEVAVYPRVLISPHLLKYIKRMSTAEPENRSQGIHKAAHAGFLCSPCPENTSRCTLDFIRADFDGATFFDTFHRDIDRCDIKQELERVLHEEGVRREFIKDDTTHERFMRNMRSIIAGFLNETTPEKERVKHLWLANYFNAAVEHLDILPIPVEWRHANE